MSGTINPSPPLAAGVGRSGLAPHALRATDEINMYVDPNAGDDDNDGITALTPCATYEGAVGKVPVVCAPDGKVIFHFAGVGGFGANASAERSHVVNTLYMNTGRGLQCTVQHRGPQMVAATPTTGSATATIASATSLWWTAGTVGNGGFLVDRVASASAPSVGSGSARRCGTRITMSGSPGWTVNDEAMEFVRIKRAGVVLIPELPVSRNAAGYLEVDVAEIGSAAPTNPGAVLASVLQAGDTIEIVKQGAKILVDPGTSRQSIHVEGGTGPAVIHDEGTAFADLGGGGFWLERLKVASCLYPEGKAISADRCTFNNGDYIFKGGTLQLVNCLFNAGATGILLAGGCATVHDQSNCRPDSASSPTYQHVDTWALDFVSKGAPLVIGRGGGYSSGWGATWTVERGISIYDCTTTTALSVSGKASTFYIPDAERVRGRTLLVQGSNNLKGVEVVWGGVFREVTGQCRVRGDLALDDFGDCNLGGIVKAWDEFETQTIGADDGNGVGNWVRAYNGSRLTTDNV